MVTTRLDVAVLRAEALELLGTLNETIGVADAAAGARGRSFPPDGVVLTMTMPTARGSVEPALGQRGRIVRTIERRGHPPVAEVAFTYRQVRAMVDRLSFDLDDLAPAPDTVANVRAYLAGLTAEQLADLHRETFPEEYAG